MKIFDLKKYRLFYILFFLIYSMSTVGVTYAYLSYNAVSENFGNGDGYCDRINYVSQAINSDDLLSSVDYLEGVNTTVTLSYDPSCAIYKIARIYLHTNTTTTAPIVEYPSIRYKVFNGSTLVSEGIISQLGDTIMATVPLTLTATGYKVYLWIDSDLSDGHYHDTVFSGYIYAQSDQTSTIDQ